MKNTRNEKKKHGEKEIKRGVIRSMREKEVENREKKVGCREGEKRNKKRGKEGEESWVRNEKRKEGKRERKLRCRKEEEKRKRRKEGGERLIWWKRGGWGVFVLCNRGVYNAVYT
ncbi:unnamed protein product [Cuscuta epithymum]|uniref:Uncharacterized protein n=1 Tax=Cuscuta epithymum TaxID=186058 RepID=A0AAV0DDC8_9ASTE|nr:unnamed protein product [Cuscuta epithymum]